MKAPVALKKNIAISETGFLFNPSTGDSYNANEVGLWIIKRMRENLSPERIKSDLTKTFDVDAVSLEKDLDDFLIQLRQFGLLENHE